MGACPVSLGTDSIYKILEELVADTEKVRKDVTCLDSPKLEAACQSKLEAAIGATVV